MVIRRVFEEWVGFLRAGQPPGAPATGYSPLLALMRRRVTDDEIADLAAGFALTEASCITVTDIAVAISKVTAAVPSDIDVDRLRWRLSADGWIIS